MTLQLNCQHIAVVSCLLAVRNGVLPRWIGKWLDRYRTSTRISSQILVIISITFSFEAVHYAQLPPAELADLECSWDYWSYWLAFSLRSGVKSTWLLLCGCCSYHTQSWMLPKIWKWRSVFPNKKNALSFALFSTWRVWSRRSKRCCHNEKNGS